MARTIRKNLDMSPGFVPPVIRVSQYDSDFTIVFALYSSFGDFTLASGTIAEIRGTKGSGTGYSATAIVDSIDGTVTVTGDNQMTAVAGKNIYEIVLSKSGKQLSSINFVLFCETAALDADTITDKSVIKEFNGFQEKVQAAQAAADRAEAAAESVGRPTDEQAQTSINNWLSEHPEATTTVQDGAVTVRKWSGSSSINNWNGETLEDKLLDFLNNADSGEKLDLQGEKITITKRFVKNKRTKLNNTIISNGIFEIPASVEGWLSIGSAGGYRVPLFTNCMFTGGGAIFYENAYNFKAVGCSFQDVQILNGTYIQVCELIGCNIMCPNNYLIECDFAIGFTMTECTFEKGNYGVFYGHGNSARPSLEYGDFSNCVFEGFLHDVFSSHGMRCVSFNSCYAEEVPHLVFDKSGEDGTINVFYISATNNRVYFNSSESTYLIESTAANPIVNTIGNYFASSESQYFTNAPNTRRQAYGLNYYDNKTYGNNGSPSETLRTNHTFNGTTLAFSTNGISLTSQPQAFLVLAYQYGRDTLLYPKISIITLAYKASTGYTVDETVLFQHASFSRTVTWTASAESMLGIVNITGTYNDIVYATIVNLGATMNGMIK